MTDDGENTIRRLAEIREVIRWVWRGELRSGGVRAVDAYGRGSGADG
jgi:hypothetical protein